MVKAVVAIEDYRFYQHGALDLKGTLRALITNQANNGVVQGGSSITQQLVKLTLHQPGQDEGGEEGRHRRHLRAQAQGAALRDRAGAEPLQGLDPRALPQHGVLRRRGVRRPGGREALLRRQRPRPQPAPVRAARRSRQEPLRLRPDQVPRPRDRAARRRPGPDGRAQRGPAREGGEEQAEGPRARRPGRRQRLRELDGAVLLRLRPGLPPAGPAAGRHRAGAQEPAQERRPDDQDHDRHDRPAGRRQRGRGAREPDRRGDRRAGHRAARHRQRARAGAVAADGQPQEAGRDLHQLHGAQGVRRRQRLPARLDVQGVHAGRRARAGTAR